MSIKSFVYQRRPELAVASEFYGAYRDFRNAAFKKTSYGFTMKAPKWMQEGSFEVDETKIIIEYLKKADVFIDVGANIGYYTFIARSMGVKVIAVEPLWHNLQYIYSNLEMNNWTDVEIFPVGLSSRPGFAVLYGVGTAASFVKDWAGLSTKKRMVPLSTLDIIAAKRFSGSRLVIKIDVEGVEFSVLKGASEVMSRMPAPVWFVETSLPGLLPDGPNQDFIKVFEMFWSNDYASYSMENGQEKRITEAQVGNWVKKLNSEGQSNFLFKKDK